MQTQVSHPPHMSEPLRAAIRSYLDQVMAETRLDLTGVARRAGVQPSTLTRFYNNPDHPHILSTRTLTRISDTTGVPFPGQSPKVNPPSPLPALQTGEHDLTAPGHPVNSPDGIPLILELVDALISKALLPRLAPGRLATIAKTVAAETLATTGDPVIQRRILAIVVDALKLYIEAVSAE